MGLIFIKRLGGIKIDKGLLDFVFGKVIVIFFDE